MIFLARLAIASPLLVASDLLDSKTLFNLGAIVSGSRMRR